MVDVGWLLQGSPDFDAVLLPDFVPEDRWNIAIAMRHGDVLLKEHVDRALEKVIRKGVVASAMKRYHTPYFEPFDSKQPDAAGANKTTEIGKALPSRAPKDRGLEPQMANRQRSRHGYGDLQKIQVRGTLIVGLDQNNLPFSTAHPGPSGLDYEVAQLLAEKLGVSLEVYWAYSSHDSYPAKLVHKKLCDVILGVMPDDRFAQRVTYSEPYYYAHYQYVVSTDNKTIDIQRLLAAKAIAMESGIAVRGVMTRQLKHYSSLESILNAVVAGKVQAGYVLSSRASWLAAEKWPGQLQFVQPKSDIDRFPICVALRRGEAELKNEIDSAFRQLRNSGQLEQVFLRWHVPLGVSSIHGNSP